MQTSTLAVFHYSEPHHSTAPSLHHSTLELSIVPPIPPSDTHYWRVAPAVGITPRLPWQHSTSRQYTLYKRDTHQPVGMVQRVPRGRGPTPYWGPVRTAWFSGDKIETKRHESVQSGRKFLERKFTRTNLPPSVPDQKLARLPASTRREEKQTSRRTKAKAKYEKAAA